MKWKIMTVLMILLISLLFGGILQGNPEISKQVELIQRETIASDS